ncbi:MAG: ComEC family competence protein, partial [Synergistaceae bacterium]|nr:ComEC family competence protein [Synergistaceae bacterium]
MRSKTSSLCPDARLRFDAPLSEAPAFLLLVCWLLFILLRGTYRYSFFASLSISLFASIGWALVGTERAAEFSLPVAAVLLVTALCGAFYLSSVISEGEGRFSVRDVGEERGRVLEVRMYGRGRVALVLSGSGKYVLGLDNGAEEREDAIQAGDVIIFSGEVERFRRAETLGAFDEYLYWRARGARAALPSPKIRKIGVSWGPAMWRDLLEKRIKEALPSRTAGYALALFVGKRDKTLESLHRLTGAAHLLAVSGAHVGIVFGIMRFLLRRFRLRLYLISAFIWLYVAMTGSSPSAVRAAFMIQLVILGGLIGRSGKTFNTASFAGALMLLLNPWLFWDVGWRLSMLAALSITSLSSTDLPGDAKIFLVCPLVWLATTIQAAWTFGESPV